ncbi:MAG: type II secretion system F family protein [Pirellulales bacterium]|nr:type II secretion system F family protein [Pirellulales bacterium]
MKFHWPGFDSLKKLSAEDSAELAARIADLARSGLPLGDGLRAMAAELSGRWTHHTLHALADRLDAGEDLAEAMEAEGRRLPVCLRGVVLAGLRSGRLAEALDQYADLRRGRSELRRRVRQALAYPFFLLVAMAIISLAVKYLIVDGFENIYRDFDTDLPKATELVLAVSGPVAWVMVALAALFAAVPLLLAVSPEARWIWPALYKLPMLGPLLRWGNLSQFSRLMALLLEQRTPLPDALRLTAAGLRDPHLAHGCLRAAEDVEGGAALSESMTWQGQFPLGIVPLIQWGERAAALDDAFRAAGESFEGRIQMQGSLLEAVLLPLMLIFIGMYMGLVVVAIFMPLIRLVNYLTW